MNSTKNKLITHLDSKYNNTDNPIFTMTSINKYMLKSIQNYVEDNENPNVIHII